MFITEREKLKNYTTENRVWQGIPAIEVTKGGRIFSSFYSGGIAEAIRNYAMVVTSEDGVNFTEPIAVAYDENHRCFDPCLWIDPLDRLWFIWSVMPDDDVYAVICDDPDADEIVWGEPRVIGKGIMMNKPTVLSTGEWLFPIAVWSVNMKRAVQNNAFASEINEKESGAFAYRSIDCGETFEKIGGIDMPNRSFDEHMFLEFKDEHIANYIRTNYGIGIAHSYDRGKTWADGGNSELGGPNSRFYIGRLKSGRILLINHYEFSGRNNLTAALSEDEGQTWKYRIMLDEREWVSYPDVKEADDGFLYITYDRERGCFKKSLNEAYESAREILYAKITEEDIMNGKLVNKDSKLRCLISKLGRYKNEHENLYKEPLKYSNDELADNLMCDNIDNVLSKLFDIFSVNCTNMGRLENEKLDELTEKIKSADVDKKSNLVEIIKLVKSVTDVNDGDFPIVDKIKEIITQDIREDLSLEEIAEKAGISCSYMMYRFKSVTGVSVNKYRTTLRITYAKRLLVGTDKSITDIAIECGFNSMPYFSDRFLKSEGVTPSEYRKRLKK